MAKVIKTPYRYESLYFGVTKAYRWLPVIVETQVTSKTFVPDIMPHSLSKDDFYKVEKDCARVWLKQLWDSPRAIYPREALGVLTLLDYGVPELVAQYGGDKKAIVNCINSNEWLSDDDSAVFICAITNLLEDAQDAKQS